MYKLEVSYLNINVIFKKLYIHIIIFLAPPPALHNVWVKPSTILANILWEVAGTGGYPIIDFTAEYRLKPNEGEEPEDWKPILPTHIPPNSVNNFSFNEKKSFLCN